MAALLATLANLALEYVLPAVLGYVIKHIPWQVVLVSVEHHLSAALPGELSVKIMPVDPAGQTQPQV